MKFKESLNLLSDMSDSQRYPLNFLHFKLLLSIYIKIVYLYLKFFIYLRICSAGEKDGNCQNTALRQKRRISALFCSDNGLKGTVGHARYMEGQLKFRQQSL